MTASALYWTDVCEEVRAERLRQDAKHGHADHSPFVYVTVLSEECGEVAREVHDAFFVTGGDLAAARAELVQVAATAMQMIERIDQGRMPWG